MNKENVLAWCEALESGEYKQAKNTLCKIVNDKASFCCLGVGCKIASIDIPMAEKINVSINSLPPIEFVKWLGIIPEQKEIKWEGLEALSCVDNVYRIYVNGQALHRLNDSGGYTFEEIAKFIRESLNILKE